MISDLKYKMFEVDEKSLIKHYDVSDFSLKKHLQRAYKIGIKSPKIIIDSNFQPMIVEDK